MRSMMGPISLPWVPRAGLALGLMLVLGACAHHKTKDRPVAPPPPPPLVSAEAVADAGHAARHCLYLAAHQLDDGTTAPEAVGHHVAEVCAIPLDHYSRLAAGQTHLAAGAQLLFDHTWTSGDQLGLEAVETVRGLRAGIR